MWAVTSAWAARRLSEAAQVRLSATVLHFRLFRKIYMHLLNFGLLVSFKGLLSFYSYSCVRVHTYLMIP